mgnify:CR=1 FL=1
MTIREASAVGVEPVVLTNESTVVGLYEPEETDRAGYQSEAELEAAFIRQLQAQAYEYVSFASEDELVANLRTQLEALNDYTFTDEEWERFFAQSIRTRSGGGDEIVEKTRRIQEDHVQTLIRDNGESKNIRLIDKQHIHNNRLQVTNQYVVDTGAHHTRYDVTVLVNGLPLVHIELKRRGVPIREAFNQINRYQRDSFWAGAGLFGYVQIFVISNGTQTKYYSNTTRFDHVTESTRGKRESKAANSDSFEFTSWWSDAANKPITDLVDFTRTFFAKHTLLALLTRYCVFTTAQKLLVMRPYQIAATEAILQRILTASANKQTGTVAGGGYIWHTTGSGKTLTSFKTAKLAAGMEGIDKVIFVVDRKDLDHQTIKEYNRFAEGTVSANQSTNQLSRQINDPDTSIIVTTIQKLSNFVGRIRKHAIYTGHVVLIFDECHRSQFGDMHTAITKAFRNYHLFGFTGTPIFAANSGSSGNVQLRTTAQAFGDQLHTYTIVDAIRDKNVLPFRIDYIDTIKMPDAVRDAEISAIDTERALLDPERIGKIVSYVLEHFDQKTKRASSYDHSVVTNVAESSRTSRRAEALRGRRRVRGFNALFATASIEAARIYYNHFALLQENLPPGRRLKIGLIYSYGANEAASDGIIDDEAFDTDELPADARSFLEDAIQDYNDLFGTSYDTSAEKFQNYYKDLSQRIKNREIDLVIVVNMFLTGFDATTLNTLFVDKNLRAHGLIQAYSRTNRILNSVKTYGNIVAFRNLEDETNAALELFGNREARGVVLLKPYQDYYREYADKVAELLERFPLGQPIIGEAAQKAFIALFGAILRLQNILSSFDDFAGNEILRERQGQDYRSLYLDLYAQFRQGQEAEKEVINDDVVFEIELIKQVEINVDYILMLVQKYRDEHGDGDDKEIRSEITRAVNASPTLRNKRDLIEAFVDSVSVDGHIDDEWVAFIEAERKTELARIIADENLKPKAAQEFIQNAFRNGELRTTGTAITKILPPVSRFAPSGGHDEKKRRVIARLSAFFDRFLGLGAAPTESPGHYD